ncbi:hypothetical protein [Streptococcus sp. zg-JUN1979]|uniref:hypothetical protein n=1 Tax=Streptococcus sp. zg-JUN1979 TaxID=3391450 RepID=UPI0039A49BFC
MFNKREKYQLDVIEVKDYFLGLFSLEIDNMSRNLDENKTLEMQETALKCLKNLYHLLKYGKIKVYQDDLLKECPLDYMNQLIKFYKCFWHGDYLECCRQLDEIFYVYPFTVAIKKNMLYLFYETVEKVETISHQHNNF